MKNKFSIAMSLAVIVAMLVTSLALADNLNNDAVSAGLNTITAGSSTTITYQLVGNNAPSGDVSGCDATSANPVTVTITKPAAVSGPSSFQFTGCGNPNKVQITFSSNTPGTYSITHAISGGVSGSLFNNNADFSLTVSAVTPTNTAPTLNLSSDLTAEATSASGAVVNYTVTASDAEDGALSPSCSPASGSTFSIGVTQVNCSVTDSGGLTTSGMFNVTVQDTTAPTLNLSNVTAEATGPSGAAVTYSASASDLVDGSITPSCSPASGSIFPLGTTTVNCSASDAAGNTSNASFSVSVVDTTPPTVTVPANMTVEATGPSGAVANFSASASDTVDGPLAATCTPASGSTFPLGTTTVNCSATDAAGNTGNATFTVKVQDTTAPTLTLPANMTVSATSAAGAAVTFSASATDIVDGSVAVSCTPASGSTFAPGTTTVTCSATDAAGNTASGSFTVTVKFQLLGFYQPVDMGIMNNTKGGSTVPLKFEVFAGTTELTNTSIVQTFTQRINCAAGTGDDIEQYATGNTTLRYDTTSGQFIFNWQTPRTPGSCYRVTLTTTDGTSIYAEFRLR